MTIRDDDVGWDGRPVEDHLAENYRELHPCDATVVAHHAAYHRTLPAGSPARTVEFGAGPNLYPLLPARPAAAPAGVRVVHGDARALPTGH